MVKVVWLSRHGFLNAEVEALKEKFGDNVEIVQINRTFRDADDVVEDVIKTGAKYVIPVIPLSMLFRCVHHPKAKSLTWIWSDFEAVHSGERSFCDSDPCPDYNPDTDVLLRSRLGTRHLRFRGFKKIKDIQLVLEDF